MYTSSWNGPQRPYLSPRGSNNELAEPNRHECRRPTGFSRGGWGRPARSWSKSYIRQKLITIYNSTQVTDEEFLMCTKLPEDDPKYQAVWALAQLGDASNE